MIEGAFVADEEEQLVLLDRSTDRPASLVIDGLGLVHLAWRNRLRPRLEMLVGVVFKQRPVHLVGAALDLYIDGGPARQPLFGVEAAGHHVDFLD